MPGVVASSPGLDDAAVVTELGPYVITLASSFGPRVLGLRLGGGPEMFARLGEEVVIERPDSGVYRLRGGHRLWVSPEVPWITYAPDDEPCQITTDPGSASVTGPADRVGLIKQIVLHLGEGRLMVDHTVVNAGTGILEVAPWSITQMRLGGTVIMPVRGNISPDGLQADRTLALWPYTSLTDPRITWRERAITISAIPGPVFKIGTGPHPGQLGYLLDGHLFTKEISPAGSGVYPDMGAVAQFFMNEQFCELESVGETERLEPGGRIDHREIWSVQACDDVETAATRVGGETGS